ncbi:MAG TPA: dipeptidase [Candidatus Polarisedimenticolia bacterium]|nr:dipeptidase [Candidatus Polarisedimenticolia bacterium]
MTRNLATLAFSVLILFGGPSNPARASDQPEEVTERARQVHDRAIVIDTHDDTPQRMVFEKGFDIGRRNENGAIDIPRMRAGGLDALFFSIWVPGDVDGPHAARRALQQIDRVREAVRTHPKDLVLATSVAGIRRAAAQGKIAALMGIEGGHMIDDDLGLLREYATLGVRYMTLTHSLNTSWADSSGDQPAHDGLTPFGKEVVREMNRLGVMVDVSHVSDKTFYDALAASAAPVIASHSSCRAVCNHPRNMTDDMLRALAKNGGVIMINFNAEFVSEEVRSASQAVNMHATAETEANAKCAKDEACKIFEIQRLYYEAMGSGHLPKATWEKILEHLDHAAQIAGVDHVGLGSDFDGAVMPLGMEDASKLPRLTGALLKKGYTEKNITKILGGNLLRVMEQVEAARDR